MELDGYKVEARTCLPGEVNTVLGKAYSNRWVEVPVIRGAMGGVPGDIWSRYLNIAGCMSYAQAYALAWAFKAEADACNAYIGVRVVRYKVKCSWSSQADGHVNELPLDARADKSFTHVGLVEP